MTLVKQVMNADISPFTHICNSSFLDGIFPEKMKVANVIPPFKGEDKTSYNNY